MRAFRVVAGVLCVSALPFLGACAQLLGDFQGEASDDGGGANESGGGEAGGNEGGGSGNDATIDVGAHDASDAAPPVDAQGHDSGYVDHYVGPDGGPDQSSPPIDGGGDATDAAPIIHGNGTFLPVQDVPFSSGSNLGPPITGPSAGPAPTGLIAADLNNDGVPDLAACTSAGVVVLISNKQGGGFKQVETSDNSITNCVGLAAFDQDNDGYLELAVIQSSPPTLYVFTNQFGSNYYIAASQYTAGPTVITLSGPPKFVAADDFNRDGVTDIAVTVGSSLQLFKNTYPGTYGLQFAANISTYEGAGDVVFRDLNGDTFPDAVVGASAYNAYGYGALPGASPPTPFFNTGGAALDYGADPYPPTAAMPLGVTTGDFDGDGLFDVAVANQGTGDVTAFYNLDTTRDANLYFRSGSGSYNPPHYTVGSSPYDIASGDFNGDTAWDLVVSVPNQLALLFGQKGQQTLATSTTTPNLSPDLGSTSSVVVGDFNSDHKLDIAALYTGTAAVAVFYGN